MIRVDSDNANSGAVAQHVRWPANRFFWAVIDASSLVDIPGVVLPVARGIRSRRAQQLGYLFERSLPGLAIDDVHARYQPMNGGQQYTYLACGLLKSTLERDIDPQTISLTPETLPIFAEVSDPRIEPDTFNLLTEAYEPLAIQRSRRRWVTVIAVFMFICAGLGAGGLARRSAALAATTASIDHQAATLIEDTLGSATGSAARIPSSLRLTGELRRLEQTRTPAPGSPETSNTYGSASTVDDVTGTLTAVLQRWPGDLHVQAESLSLTSSSITIRAQVPSMTDAQRFADALIGIPGWRLTQPRSDARRGHVDVTLRLEPGLENNQGDREDRGRKGDP